MDFLLNPDSVLKSLVTLFVIMDPFSSIPVFVMLTKKTKENERVRAAGVACAVAAIVLVLFMLAGPWLLGTMGITLKSFMVAGGLLLLITAIQFFLGIEFGKGRERDVGVEVVLIGTPLLTGPGVMATSIILTATFGMANVMAAALIAVAVSFATLLLSSKIHRLIGRNGLQIFSKIMAILLAAISVEFIRNGMVG